MADRRDRAVLTDLTLLAGTALRLLAEDPMHALVQASRRVPARLRRHLAPGPGRPSLLRVLRAWLADHPDHANQILADLEPRGGPAERLRELLAVALGQLDVVLADPEASGSARARALWQLGRLTEAEAELAGVDSALARRIASEHRILQPGTRVELRRRSPVRGRGVLMALTNCQPWTRSGYTNRSQHILTALSEAGVPVAAVTRIGYPVTVGLPGRLVRHQVGTVPYHRLPTPSLAAAVDDRLGQQAHLIRELAKQLRPGVLHTTTDYTNAVAVRAVAEATGLPWVYEMRGMLELTWIASRPAAHRADVATSERVQLLRAKESELAQQADAVVCLSGVQRADLVDRGVAAEKILVAPNAVAQTLLEREPITPARARDRLGLPRAGFWVGTVTSMVDYEGLDTLVRAIALARAEGHDIRAALVGDGVSRPGLHQLVADLGLAQVVQLPGRVAPDRAPEWFEALDLFTVPRRDTPVCRMVTPLKPLEAMALRRPVMASELPALTEIIGAPGAGQMVAPDDPQAWATALIDAAEGSWTAAAAERGHDFAARRTWSRIAADYAALYDTLTKEP